MLRELLSPPALRQAVDHIRRGPYVEGAVASRPWLRLAAFVGLSAVFVLGFILIVGVIGAVAASAGVVLINPDLLEGTRARVPLGEEIRFVIALAVILILMALCLLQAAVIAYQRPARAFLWPAQRGGWRQLGVGAVVMMALGFLQWPLFAWLEPGGVSPILDVGEPVRDRVAYALAIAAALFFAAAAEEIAFRGVLLRILGGLSRHVWVVLVLNGVLFSLIHLDPDPVAFVARALSGMVWTWAALRLGGLAFGIGSHWANNLFIGWFLEPISVAATPAQGTPPSYLAAELLVTLVVFIAVELLARGRAAAR